MWPLKTLAKRTAIQQKKTSVCLKWPIWRRKKRPNCIWKTKSNPSIEPRNDNDDISLQRRMGVCESHTGAVWQLGRHIKLLTPEAFSRQLIQDFLSFFCPFPMICLFSSVNPRFPDFFLPFPSYSHQLILINNFLGGFVHFLWYCLWILVILAS